jgi:prepilin-type N-terminal cleavage/methylation domain-containing protein
MVRVLSDLSWRHEDGLARSASIRRRSKGFSLIEVAMVLLIIGILATIVGNVSVSAINEKRRNDTKDKIKAVDAALIAFVVQNRRLPCPASGLANDGAELCGLMATFQQNGVVPWKSLGLSLADITDGWGNQLTYRVDSTSYVAGQLDMTLCSPGGSAASIGSPNFCSATCSTSTFPSQCTPPNTVLANRGLRIRNASGTLLADPSGTPAPGAAYVVISHGENQEGAFSYAGVIVASGSPASGTREPNNFASAAYDPSSSGSYLVDSEPSYTATTSHFDDLVSRPSILSVATKASLGPRAY